MTILTALNRFVEAASVAEKWRVIGPTERRLQRALRTAFEAQGKIFMRGFAKLQPRFVEARKGERRRQHRIQRLRETISADDWLQVFDQTTGDTVDLFFSPIQDAIRRSMRSGAGAAIADVGIDIAFTLAHPRAVQYLDQHGYGLIRQINAVTRGNIATIISNGVAEGWSYNRMAREITSLYREMAIGRPQQHIQSRAHLIAITEAGNAYESGGATIIQDLQDAGLRMEKHWLTVGDDRVSEGCRDNQASGWIPFSQAFPSGHMHPLRFPGCRCSTLYQRSRG